MELTSCMYDGMVEPTKFIEFFKLAAVINSWDATAQLTNINAFLKDKAEAVVAALTDKSSIALIFDGLRKGCSEPFERQMVKFRERKPSQNESFTKYAAELRKLLKGADPLITEAQILLNIRTQLRLHMPRDSMVLLQVYKDKSLVELLQLLDDAVPTGAHDSTKSEGMWHGEPTKIKSEPLETHYTSANLPQRGSNARFNGSCNYCGTYGHKMINCRTRVSDQSQQYNTPNRASNGNNVQFSQNQYGQPRPSYHPSNFRGNAVVRGSRGNLSNNRQNTNQPPMQHYNNNNNNAYNNNSNYNRLSRANNNFTSGLNDNLSWRNDNETLQRYNWSLNGDQPTTENINNGNEVTDNRSKIDNDQASAYSIDGEAFPYFSFSESSSITAMEVHNEFPFSLVRNEQPHTFIPPSLGVPSLDEHSHHIAINMIENIIVNSDSMYKHVTINSTEFEQLSNTSTSLLKIPGKLSIFEEFPVTCNILIDGGSTHSFISPTVLNESHKTHLVTRDTATKQRRNFVITSATHDVTSECTVAIATISIQSWSGKFQFTISDKIMKNDVVLGRDFLHRYNASVKHGDNTMVIENVTIDFNIVHSFKSVSFDRKIIVHQPSSDGSSDEDATFDAFANSSGKPPKLPSSGFTSTLCFATEATTIKPLSQKLVKIKCSVLPKCNILFFEPCASAPAGCLVARSIGNPENIYCNVINTLESSITIAADTCMGSFVNATLVESNDKDEYEASQSRITKSASIGVFSTKMDSNNAPPNVNENEWNNICSIPIGKNLEKQQVFELRLVLLKNYKSFQWDPNTISRTHLVEHSIDTGNAAPIKCKQYPLPTIALEQIRQQAAQMLKEGTIRHSNSAWQSPILLIKQEQADGSMKYRFCIDLRKVNAVTTKDSYSLPRINETVDRLNGMIYFSQGDIDRAFWQVGVVEADKCKNAFAVDGRLYEGNVMAFGSQNAPATFQRLVNTVLHGLTYKQCLAYIDDILIFSRAFTLHLTHVDEVLSRIGNANLKLKPSKCSFGRNEVEYLGFKISDQGIQRRSAKLRDF